MAADAPLPESGQVVPVRTRDGVSLRAMWWPCPPHVPNRGTILVMQGRAEFIEKYGETIGELRARGYAVVAFDWRGQGLSDRGIADPEKGHIVDFALYARDLAAVEAGVLAPHCPPPWFGLAHSMGGCIALTAALENRLPVGRLVAAAPMVELRLVKFARLVRVLLRCLMRFGLAERFVPGGDGHSISTLPFPGNRLSADPERYARNAALAHAMGAGAIGAPTNAWLGAAYRAMSQLRALARRRRVTIPILIVAAGDDPVCSTPAIEALARRLGTGPALVIPGSRHEILMERDAVRNAFWRAFDAFMPPGGSAGELPEHGIVQARVPAGDD